MKSAIHLATALCSALLLASAAHAQRAPVDVPFDLHGARGGSTGDRITFCIDDRTPGSKIGEAIASAVAEQMLVTADFYRLSELTGERTDVQLGIPDALMFILLDDHCDAFVGMPLGARTVYPEFLTFTEPYMASRFVIAARAKATLDDFADDGSDRLGVPAASPLFAAIGYYKPDVRLRIYGDEASAISGLRSGQVAGAVFNEKSLREALSASGEASQFEIGPITGIPDLEWQDSMALLNNQTYLREQLSEAIRGARASGRIAELLAAAGLPTQLTD